MKVLQILPANECTYAIYNVDGQTYGYRVICWALIRTRLDHDILDGTEMEEDRYDYPVVGMCCPQEGAFLELCGAHGMIGCGDFVSYLDDSTEAPDAERFLSLKSWIKTENERMK